MTADPFTSAEGLGDRLSLPTTYDGVQFRSRLEARWAVLFDLFGWEWSYEPERFYFLGWGSYLPDFRITAPGLPEGCRWVEVKGQRPIPASELDKIARFRALGHVLSVVGDIPNIGRGAQALAYRFE